MESNNDRRLDDGARLGTAGGAASRPKGLFILKPEAFELIYNSRALAALGQRVDFVPKAFTAHEILFHPELLAETELIFSGWGAPRLDAAFLDLAPRLRAFFYGSGCVKSLITDEFWGRNIPIVSAVSANAIPVAEFALAQIILSLKRAWWNIRETRESRSFPAWEDNDGWCAGSYGSTVGLIALGQIGRALRERLRILDVHVIAYDPYLTHQDAEALGVEKVSLEELFLRSDVASLHAPWISETEGMITGELLRSMKRNATFINTARGAVVKEEEMIDVLRERPDLYAVLDVTDGEPPRATSPLYTLPNVILTPHIAGSRHGECARMGQLIVEETMRFLDRRPLRWEVTQTETAVAA